MGPEPRVAWGWPVGALARLALAHLALARLALARLALARLALALARAHFPFGTNSKNCMHHLCLSLSLSLLCLSLSLLCLSLYLFSGPFFQKCFQKRIFLEPRGSFFPGPVFLEGFLGKRGARPPGWPRPWKREAEGRA